MTILVLHLSQTHTLSIKALTLCLGKGATHPQLPACEINQTFLSTNLAYLLTFEWQAARSLTHTFQ